MFRTPFFRFNLTFRIAAALLGATCSSMLQANPVKIFILAGESNMHGKGSVSPVGTKGTLDYIVANDPTGKYQFLKSGGSYVTRTDVAIRGLVFSGAPNPGNLTIGYGGNAGGLIGPELGFGHRIGDAYEDQVLIVKVGVDGTTLAGSFCPPSSRVGEPEPLVAGDKGFYYKEIIRLVNEAKAALGATPHEIVGLGWHQGWNDRVTPAFSAAYETNMANFINNIRTDLAVPNMPIVIATAAMDPYQGYSEVEIAQLKMANATAYPAFAGNVAVVDTRVPYEDLEFWQAVALSPADEGYHWNRSGKTYLHIGLAMGDAMSLLAPNRIPYRLRSSGGPSGTTLTWKNGTEIPTSVRVLRNGVEIAASAPATPSLFVDASPPLGLNSYELQFTMPGNPAPPLSINQNTGVTGLAGNQRVNGLKLTWNNNLSYTGIQVKRNGSVIATALPGTATSYVDFTPPSGTVTYSVEPVDAGSTPAEVIVTVSAAPAGGALIYEPFDMTAGTTLDGKEGGIGLDGHWNAGSTNQVSSTGLYSFGTLPTFGNRIVRTGGNGSCFIKIGDVLKDAGLMSDGAQLWFSFLCQNTNDINNNPNLSLGNDSVTYFNKVANSGSAIGVRLHQAKNVQGMIMSDGVEAGASATQTTLGTSEVVLVVGRITWGANATAPDTLDIFTPGPDLVLDTPQSVSAVVDQSTFNIISTWGNGTTPNLDEIRFGATYDDVIGQGTDTSGDFTPPTPATSSFSVPPTATSQSVITMTATTASDANGVQYRFLETSGNPGGTSSGWQDSSSYIDTGLNPNTEYTYTIQARDKSVNNNSNTVSAPASTTTLPPDLTPPANPSFATPPNAISFSAITMTATVVTDPEGGAVEYYFTETSGNPGGTSSGWQSSPTYTDTGLDPSTQYTYTVMARDSATPPNETAASASASATTTEIVPTTYIRQNNTSLLNTSAAWAGGPPLGVDTVQWDATCAGNRSTALGGNVTWGKIAIATGTAGAVTIGNSASSTLSLNGVGGIGIDMSAAPVDLTINNPITLGSSQSWDITTSRTLTIGNYAIGDGGSNRGITKAGAGTLALQGSNTFTGPVSITGGTLSINSIANGGSVSGLGQSANAATNLLLGNGTSLTYTGPAASSDRSFTINGTAAGHGATLNASGAGALNLTSTSAIAFGTADQTRTLTLTGSNNLAQINILSAQITNNGTGAVSLSKTGTGSVWWVTNPNNNFTGGVTFNRGFLVFSSGALGTSGTIGLGANSLPPCGLRWASGNTDDISSRFNSTGSSGRVTLDTGANDVVFASAIAMRPDSWLIKEGSGSLTLNAASGWGSGANAATLINAGTLVAKVLANGVTNSSVGNIPNTAVSLGLRGGTLKYTGTGATTDHNFHLSGNNTIDASGTGALIFSQTGAISPTPAARTFIVGGSASIGNSTVSSADLVPGMDVSGAGIQAGSKIVSVGTNGTIILDKTPTYTGASLSFGSYAAGTLTLTGTNTGANEIKGILQDSVSAIDSSVAVLGLLKNGVGKWILSGANTYTGETSISAGTLALGANNVLPNSSAISIGAATLDVATFADTAGTLDVTGAVVINLGSGATLAFADSSAIDWAEGTLNITGTLGATSLRFGTSSSGLTSTQLASISVNSSGTGSYVLDSNGYLILGAPEIAVEQPVPTDIANGGTQEFGTVTIGANVSLVFTIRNTGTSALTLTGVPQIAVSGSDADDFTVTASATSPIAPNSTTAFTVRFTPGGVGLRSAILTIANNDSNEGSFTILVSGSGQTSFDAWSGGAAVDEDANGDGVKNGMAFLLGAANKEENAVQRLPIVTQTGGALKLTFKCLNAAQRGTAVLKVQYSRDLGLTDLWSSHDSAVVPGNAPATINVGGVDFVTSVFDANLINVEATIPASAAEPGDKIFGRLLATP